MDAGHVGDRQLAVREATAEPLERDALASLDGVGLVARRAHVVDEDDPAPSPPAVVILARPLVDDVLGRAPSVAAIDDPTLLLVCRIQRRPLRDAPVEVVLVAGGRDRDGRSGGQVERG
jgi:hypothetical protein